MVILFETKGGAKYKIDHALNTFTQTVPKERTGPLRNVPQVLVGKRVIIFTDNADQAKPLRCIETGVVKSRRVDFEDSVR